MYAYLQGKFTYKSPAQIYIDVNGIGFEVNISLHTYSAIQNMVEGRLFIHMQVKEDGHSLFGFFDKEEKDIFFDFSQLRLLPRNVHSFIKIRGSITIP